MDYMKAFITTAKWYFFLLIITVLFNSPFVYGESIELIVDEWPPYIDSTQPGQGLMADVVTQAFMQVGIKVNLIYQPWKRVERDVDKKEAISFGWIKNDERLEKWHFSNEVMNGSSVFVKRRDSNITWKTLDDLRPYQIGITRGYSYGSNFDAFKDKLMIQEASKDEHNLGRLLKNRIDLFAVDHTVATLLLNSKFSAEERNQLKIILEPTITSYSSFVICAKTYKKCTYYLNKFNDGLALLREKGN